MNGFNEDRFILNEVERLVGEYDVSTIVETGTYEGQTAAVCAGLVNRVHTIEIDTERVHARCGHLRLHRNVTVHCGSSADLLPAILKREAQAGARVLFYLDAHWHEHWPLLDELVAIANAGLNACVIVIHDFKVPGKDFGYDTYRGQVLDFDYVKSSLEQIYGPAGFNHAYNDRAEGARRGVLYVTPAQRTCHE
jgi:hypothetical protein